MVSNTIRNKFDNLWDQFASGGIVNPLEVIEQITYLMFIRELDVKDNEAEKSARYTRQMHIGIFSGEKEINGRKIDGEHLKWSKFKDFPAEQMYEVVQQFVFPFIINLHDDKNSSYAKYMSDAMFKLPTPLLLQKTVTSLDEIFYDIENEKEINIKENGSLDILGDSYEYLLSKIASAGRNGQFRTPRHIIQMMVELVAPTPIDTICDPACGTSGFLMKTSEYLVKNHKDEIFLNPNNKNHYKNAMFHGYDMDRTMLRIGAMNMMTHGIENPTIDYKDSLSDQNTDIDKYSIVLANPPFKGSLDYDIVSDSLLKVCKTKKTELLFLALFIRILKTGGRCACIVPDGVMFGSSTAHKAIRKEIVDKNQLEAVISMPSGVFKPYAGVSTAIIVFTKTGHGGTDNVWFYDMEADGYTLDDKRAATDANDIPDIIARFKDLESEKDRKRTEKSFLVPKEEIVENDYDLSINKYKEIEYIPVEYPPTSELLADIRKLELEFAEELTKLEELLR